MEYYLSLAYYLGAIIQALIIVSGVILFFRDDFRKWNFFGFRPTAMLVMFDSKAHKLLLVREKKNEKPNYFWTFCQGGIFSSDIDQTVRAIALRELGLCSQNLWLRFIKVLGAQKINDPDRMKRATFGSFSLCKLRGKGYIGCFIKVDMEKMNISLGMPIEEAGWFTFDQAKNLLKEGSDEENTPKKKKMYQGALRQIEKII